MRRVDWDVRFVDTLTGYLRRPFHWRDSNCLTMANDVVDAVIGKRPWDDVLGTFDSEESAERRLGELGFKSLHAFISDTFDRRTRGQQMRGDLAMVRQGRFPVIGIVVGHEIMLRGEHGVVYLGPDEASSFYAVE